MNAFECITANSPGHLLWWHEVHNQLHKTRRSQRQEGMMPEQWHNQNNLPWPTASDISIFIWVHKLNLDEYAISFYLVWVLQQFSIKLRWSSLIEELLWNEVALKEQLWSTCVIAWASATIVILPCKWSPLSKWTIYLKLWKWFVMSWCHHCLIWIVRLDCIS